MAMVAGRVKTSAGQTAQFSWDTRLQCEVTVHWFDVGHTPAGHALHHMASRPLGTFQRLVDFVVFVQ